MREAQSPSPRRNVGDDAVGHRLVKRVEQFVLGDAGQATEPVERELAPQHRGEHQHPVALVR
jgi:hypothetical protein